MGSTWGVNFGPPHFPYHALEQLLQLLVGRGGKRRGCGCCWAVGGLPSGGAGPCNILSPGTGRTWIHDPLTSRGGRTCRSSVVVSWLSQQHNFPQGMIFFSDGLVHDPLRQKATFSCAT